MRPVLDIALLSDATCFGALAAGAGGGGTAPGVGGAAGAVLPGLG